MKNSFLLKWTLANAIGLSFAFLAYIQFLLFYQHGLNFERHWDFEANMTQEEMESHLYIGIPFGLALFGIIFSSIQALILKKFIPKIWPWILNGAIGFVIVSLIIWLIGSAWGDIPGPVEPLIIIIGALTFTTLLQWRFLNRNQINATKALLMFIVGVLLGNVLLFLLFYFILGGTSWPLEIAITGLIVGGSAGFLSAKPYQKVLEERSV